MLKKLFYRFKESYYVIVITLICLFISAWVLRNRPGEVNDLTCAVFTTGGFLWLLKFLRVNILSVRIFFVLFVPTIGFLDEYYNILTKIGLGGSDYKSYLDVIAYYSGSFFVAICIMLFEKIVKEVGKENLKDPSMFLFFLSIIARVVS